MKMTISRWLAVALAITAPSLISVGTAGLEELKQAQQRFEDFQEKITGSVDDLNAAISHIYKNRVLLMRWALQRDTAAKKTIETQIADNVQSLNAALDKFERDDLSDSVERTLLDDERAKVAAFVTQQQSFISAYSGGNIEGALAMLDDGGSVRIASLAIQTAIEQHIARKVKGGELLREENREAYKTALLTLLGIIAVGTTISGGLALHLQRSIVRSLKGIQATLTNARETLDLTNEVRVERMDEVGETAEAFNALQNQVSQVIASVRQAADAVQIASREIASGNVNLSCRTEEQAASLEETASSMIHISETAKENAANARRASLLAGNTSSLADEGNRAVIAMVQTMRDISHSSGKISEITSVIESIAFQTNILALNASVEAARAGEDGRGFAVVASDVRSLAQRSSTAAREIKGLIESSAATIQEGSERAREVGATMSRVKEAIEQVSGIVEAIAAASKEQETGIGEISQAVSQMDEVTQQNAALVEQAAAAAQSLDEQATSLRDEVSMFKVGHVLPQTVSSHVDSIARLSSLGAASTTARPFAEHDSISNVRSAYRRATANAREVTSWERS
ncbi:methyl-accepting chemotaxis protein [Caballeronia sp. INSB1]|uniref:methyl-accepting chemotaxis protein n=1 Tax=Caballeronia sp. INSB1 TaxID=2921751 RepID=UPI0020323BC7|nr:methyl-accepting chemotaxis protein [Caballeronia sp. INSB1]